MGRRTEMSKMDPKTARDLFARHFRRLGREGGINLAEYRAQQEEEKLVEMLIGFAYDVTQPVPDRRMYAKDVLELARGKIVPWVHGGQTIDPGAIGETGLTTSAEMVMAREMADVDRQIADLMMKRIPPAEWPEEVKLRAGNLIQTLQAEDVKLEGPVIEGGQKV